MITTTKTTTTTRQNNNNDRNNSYYNDVDNNIKIKLHKNYTNLAKLTNDCEKKSSLPA